MNATDTLPITELTPEPEALALLAPPKRRSRWLWIGGGAALALLALSRVIWSGGGSEGQWETAEVGEGALELTVTAVGQLEPITSVEVSSELSGRVLEVLVLANDPVAAGQVLARLDPEPFESAVTQAAASAEASRAAVEQARVTLRAAELHLGRTTRLEARGAATAVEVEDAQVKVDAARATLSSARAQLDQAVAALDRKRQDVEKSVITSPIDGVVIRRQVEPGQTVVSAMQATSLFEVASDLGDLRAEVGVDEADVGRVAAGQSAHFTVSAWPDRVFEARVVTVDLAPDATASVVSYQTELHIDNAARLLRPGMTATAEIDVERLDGVAQVPTEALRFRPEDREPPAGSHLWTLSEGALVPVPITVLGSAGTLTAVDGVAPGSVVVLDQARR
ncbi:MAG: efflux RND transporter periplasmic adaptor subunit [Deltaproteobacteria bacterium]|nr:efflux RND transporter periplasmic adaptor subunit [Deltaproteobacteria bacterium]